MARAQSRNIRITTMAAATIPVPYVTVRAAPSSSSSAAGFCVGMLRGGGSRDTIGGRQPGGGGLVLGGPAYVGPGCGVGVVGLDASAGSGLCQYSSSGTPVEALTFTDGTAGG